MSDSSPPLPSLGESRSRSSVVRRIVMPLLILIVAGAILFWGRQTEDRDLREVEQAVRSLTSELFHARPDGPMPERARQMGVSHSMARRVHQIFENHEWDQVRVEVYTGDTKPPYGDGRATHHAMIFINQQQQIGLRLNHRGDPDQIEVLGYWIPDAALP